MWDRIQNEWGMTWKAGTIIWSRIKVTIGLLWTLVSQSGVDLATVISNPKVLLATKVAGGLLLLDGAVSEAVRRHNATDLQ